MKKHRKSFSILNISVAVVNSVNRSTLTFFLDFLMIFIYFFFFFIFVVRYI